MSRKYASISDIHCTKNWSFPLRISSVTVTKSAGNYAYLITFTEEILNGKLHFLCSDTCKNNVFDNSFFSQCLLSMSIWFHANLITLTEQILNGKLHFLCSDTCKNNVFDNSFFSQCLLGMSIWFQKKSWQ